MTVNRIKVTCEAPAHEGKVATVTHLDLLPGHGWLLSVMGMFSGKPENEVRTQHSSASIPIAEGGPARTPDDDVNHTTHHLKCPLCSKMAKHDRRVPVLDVQVRQDRLNTICDTAAAAGESRITLRGLGARVANERR